MRHPGSQVREELTHFSIQDLSSIKVPLLIYGASVCSNWLNLRICKATLTNE